MTKVTHYRDLRVWQEAVELAVKVYQATESFPRSEQFGLVNQMRRAAVSVPSNIAEGHRRSDKEFARYLEIARGSLAELETQVEISIRVNFLVAMTKDQLIVSTGSLGRQLTALYQRVTSSRQPLSANRQQPS